MYLHIHTYMDLPTDVCTFMQVHTCTYLHRCTDTCVCLHVCTHMQTSTCKYMHVNTHVYALTMCVHTYMYIHVCNYIQVSKCKYLHVCTYCVCTFIYVQCCWLIFFIYFFWQILARSMDCPNLYNCINQVCPVYLLYILYVYIQNLTVFMLKNLFKSSIFSLKVKLLRN